MTKKILVRNGYVLSMSGLEANDGFRDVLIAGGLIAAIAPSISSDDATVIDAEGCIVMPGLVDAHRHYWYTPIRAGGMDHTLKDIGKGIWSKVGRNLTPEDIYAATRAGIVEALNMGVTTVLDYCHALNSPAHADRAIDAHLELPARALYAYGPGMAQKVTEITGGTPVTDWSYAKVIQDRLKDSARISLALALQGPVTSGRKNFEYNLDTARKMGVPISAHIAVNAGGPKNQEIGLLHEWGLLGPDMSLVHCVGSSEEDFAKMYEAKVQVSVTPLCEWFIGMGMPPMTLMHRAGLKPAIGADSIIASSGDLFEEARAGLLAARCVAQLEVIASGPALSRPEELEMTTMEGVETITSRGAAAVLMPDTIGTLEIGKKADVIAVSNRGFTPESNIEAGALLMGSAAAVDVKTVIVDGLVVKDRGRLVGIDTESIQRDLVDARKRMKSYLNL
ncbi:amidohydrolase family protein [Mesorhizobium sp.]|uniref:amidohydrolase family protein n=1 Tax=Mesorhizobium sp. TaxID=1871066 RepID=UPI0025D00D59|nr:amidohydrolase family protein [Mesorhizobium sp.]